MVTFYQFVRDALLTLSGEAPLDPAPLVALVSAPDMGAIVTFAGIVRNNFGGRLTAYLEYEAFEPMATAVLAQLAAEAQAQWNTGAIAIHHRVGRLEIGETAVLIVVAAPHRHEAFEAAEQIMDRMSRSRRSGRRKSGPMARASGLETSRKGKRQKVKGKMRPAARLCLLPLPFAVLTGAASRSSADRRRQ
jgi:molybdopterin synthase catalytic subunit